MTPLEEFNLSKDRSASQRRAWTKRRELYGSTGVRSYKKRAPVSEETRFKLSERMKRRWLDPEYRVRGEAHLRVIQAKGSAAGNLGRKKFVPERGTPEQRLYEKIRLILGTEAAKQALGL